MYAIVDIAGKQVRVEKDMIVKVPLLKTEPGKKVDFDKVLLIDSGKGVKVGSPVLEGAKVSGKVVDHGRDKKVIVFKKKRRKGYKVKNGHRQDFTTVQISSISEKKAAKKSEAAAKPAKKSEAAAKPAKKSEAAAKPAKKSEAAVKPAKKSETEKE